MTPTIPSTRRRGPAALAAATLLIVLTACSGGESGSDDSAGSVAPEIAAGDRAVNDSAAQDVEADSSTSFATQARAADAPREEAAPELGQPALIATGNVALRAKDVGQARFDVQKIVDGFGGQVGQEKTEADKEGAVERARMVVRVPSDDFDAAMEALEDVADLITTRTDVEDVTTQVIDTDVRVRLQQRSIERIELLLDRAQSIRDIVSIEGQLSRREADLASLEQQQAFLADQTSMATITVSVERPPAGEKLPPEDDEAGFLAGLQSGWSALSAMTVGLLTASGALLPFAVLLGALALLARPALRRLGRLRRTPSPTAPAEA